MTILMYIGVVIGAIIVAYAIFMLIMALVPREPVPAQPLEKAAQPAGEADDKPSVARKDVSFGVKGAAISAWLYLRGCVGPGPLYRHGARSRGY